MHCVSISSVNKQYKVQWNPSILEGDGFQINKVSLFQKWICTHLDIVIQKSPDFRETLHV